MLYYICNQSTNEQFIAQSQPEELRPKLSKYIQERYKTLGDLPQKLAIFPLYEVILLPGATLPLNIFEQRFLEMVDDAISSSRMIGLIQPQYIETEDEEGPDDKAPMDHTVPLHKVGCAGRITSYSELEDGRILTTLTGICRFELTKEQDFMPPYRIASVDYTSYLGDLRRAEQPGEIDRDNLLDVLKSYLIAHNLKADWGSINKSSDEFLVNTLAMMSPYGAEEKQALLEAKDLKTRAEILIALAEMELATRDDGSSTILQ